MNKLQYKFFLTFIFFLTFVFLKNINAQPKIKYLKSEIKKISIKGEQFLQRDMTDYVLDIKSNNKSDFKSNDDELIMLSYLNKVHPSVSTIDKYFKYAANEFKVPYEILKAVAYVETNWTQYGPSIDKRYGIMALADNNGYCNSLGNAAKRINSTSLKLKNNTKQNIRGYAALLAQNAGKERMNFKKYEDWFDALMITSGHINAEIQEMAVEEYFKILKNGVISNTLWNEKVVINSHNNINILNKLIYKKERLARQASKNTTEEGDWYPGATITESQFQSDRSAGVDIDVWVNHWILGGTYESAISWFQNPANPGSSAHFVIKHDGSLTQMVSVAKKAWHATNFNSRSIGIEHSATIAHPDYWQDNRMLKKSAEVANYYCNLKGIPKIKRVETNLPGIYGHTDMTTVTKNCPGPLPWDTWMMYLNGGIKLVSILSSNNNKGVTANWRADNDITSINGFRLYYCEDDNLAIWKLAANETTLTENIRTITINDPANFIVPPTNEAYYFKMTMIKSDGTETNATDIYAKSSLENGNSFTKVLIVDGFNRYVGSYTETTHSFTTTYFKGVRNVGNYVISSCSNTAIVSEDIQLENYNIVIWYTGDESTKDHPFDPYEQDQIEDYLHYGGSLFVTGSELAWALDFKGGTENSTYYNNDRAFYNNYLKADYDADGESSGSSPAIGLTDDFDGVSLAFGVVYAENSPDEITSYGGSTKIMKYQNNKYCGISYKGTFGSSSKNAQLVHLSFALETVADQNALNIFFNKLMQFFGTGGPSTSEQMLDDFEINEGHFYRNISFSGSTVGINSENALVDRVTTNPKNGIGALKIEMDDKPDSNDDWFVRLLSGSGTPENNILITPQGKISLWLYSSMVQNNAQVFLWLDDIDGIEESNRITINNDGQYHLYEWDLTDNTKWNGFTGNGNIDGENVTLDAIMFTSPNNSPLTTIYIDDVFHNIDDTNIEEKKYDYYKTNFYIYPNPAKDLITIHFDGMKEGAIVKIYSLTGSLVKELQISEFGNSINIADLQNGVYQLSLYQNGKLETARFVKR